MILSVSRRTDIPAFYFDWFYNRIKEGFVFVRNPINKNLVSKVILSPELIDCIVFWTKNPSKSFISNLNLISNFNYYFQFTINSYDTSLEKNVPKKQRIIETFKELSTSIGKNRLIWRYDPILLSQKYTIDYHIEYFDKLAEQLYPYTEKCIISFVDFYKKCERNLSHTTIRVLEESEILKIAERFKEIASKYNLKLETCAEIYNLDSFSIGHARCIDSGLIERLSGKRLKAKKDKNQRDICGCIESIDVGEYNTCRHHCLYCYANFNEKEVLKNIENHNSGSPLLIGDIKTTDIIKERQIKSIFNATLFD